MTQVNAALAADARLRQQPRAAVLLPAHSLDFDRSRLCGRLREGGAPIVADLKSLGFEAELRETPGRPMVVAHYTPKTATKSTPHVLFYGHYDVQPADPLDLWNTPPFEPVRRKDADGVERTRRPRHGRRQGPVHDLRRGGAGLDHDHGFKLPIRATFLIEGEEESGSPSLIPFLKANKKELSCDIAFVCDTNMWDAKTPAITTQAAGPRP